MERKEVIQLLIIAFARLYADRVDPLICSDLEAIWKAVQTDTQIPNDVQIRILTIMTRILTEAGLADLSDFRGAIHESIYVIHEIVTNIFDNEEFMQALYEDHAPELKGTKNQLENARWN